MVQIIDLEDTRDADRWIDAMIQRPFDDLILLTGEGLRKLLLLSGTRLDAFSHALARIRTVTRGPKPVRALRELGLLPKLMAKIPTSQGVLDVLAGEELRDRRVGVQLYPGEGGLPLLTSLRARGAELFPVTPYRYASQADSARVAEAIRGLAAGAIQMVVFTSSPQVERLIEVARESGLEAELAAGLARARIASIGPVVAQTLRRHGIAAEIQPQASFHLKPMVREIIAAWGEP
jgi:uroporphyrinogen-III synthase